MNSVEAIIRQAQKILYCPACGRTYHLKEIKLRGIFDNTFVFQTVCSLGHVAIFRASWSMPRPVSAKSLKKSIQPITLDDVIEAHTAIEEFDGDFSRLWKDQK